MKNAILTACVALAACAGRGRTSASGEPAPVPEARGSAAAITFDANRNPVYYAVAMSAGKIRVYNLVEKPPFAELSPEGRDPLLLHFSRSGDSVTAVFKDGKIAGCNIYTKACSAFYTSPSPGRFAAFLPAAEQYLFQTESGRLDFIGGLSWRVTASTGLPAEISAFATDPENNYFVAGLKNGEILIWSIGGRGVLARARLGAAAQPAVLKLFTYSELPSGGVEKIADPRKVPRRLGLLVLDRDGTFTIFNVAKGRPAWSLTPINTSRSDLGPGYAPVPGAEAADYILLSNRRGALRFFSLDSVTLSYEDKELAEMLKGIPVSEGRAKARARFVLPHIQEQPGEDLSLSADSLLSLSRDGRYFAAAAADGGPGLIRNPLVVKRFAKLVASADQAASHKKYDMAITLYSQALGLYQEESLEAKRDKVWEAKRAAEAELAERMRSAKGGR